MAEVGSAFVSILPSAKGFGRKLESGVGGELGSSGRRMGSALGSAIRVGALAAVGGALLAGKFLKGALDEAREAQVVTARTENVIAKMGNAANISAKQVATLAGAISAKTGIDDEAIQSGQNLLLTFGNVRNEVGKGNDIFNQASRLMVDMSAAMGTDAKGSAIQLGKALNDPIKGLTALSRVGVSFTEQQKEQITTLAESGKTMQAQKIILGELERQFGGAAAAMATPADKAKVAWANFKEEIGTRLLPVVDKVLTKFTEFLPTLLGWVDKIGPAFSSVVAAIMPVVSTIRDAVQPVLDKVGNWIRENPVFVKAFAIALGVLAAAIGVVTLATAAFSVALNSTGIPLIIIGIAALAAGLVVAYQRSEQFRAVVQGLAAIMQSFGAFLRDQVLPVVVDLAQKVGDSLQPIFAQLAATFRGSVLPAVQQIIAKFQEWQPTIQKVIAVVVQIIAKMLEFAAAIYGKVLPPVIRFAGFLLSNWVSAVLAAMGAVVKIIAKVIEFGRAVVDQVQKVAQFVAGVKEKFGDALAFIKTVPARVSNSLGDLGNVLYAKGQQLIQGLIDGIKSKIGDIAGVMGDVAGKIGGFLPGSPVKEGPLTSWNNGAVGQRLMALLAKGIEDGSPLAEAAASRAAEKIRAKFESMRDSLKSTLDQLKSDFASLSDSITSAFTGDLFGEVTTGAEFIKNLLGERSELKGLKEAFKTLLGWGINPQFLSQLFASGNGALILDLADHRNQAKQASQLFKGVNVLGNQLGNAVADADIGPRIDKTNQELREVQKILRLQGREFAAALANVAASASRGNAA